MDNFFLRLQKCAEAKGISQSDVARDLDIPTGTISRYFTGDSMPKTKDFYKLARYFGVSMEWLLTGEHPDEPMNRVQEEAAVYGASRKKWMAEVLSELDACADRLKEKLEGKP